MSELPTAVLCTPIDVEREAVLGLLRGRSIADRERNGVLYRTTEYEARDGCWNLALAMGGRGNAPAAAAVEHAVAAWRPQILVVCGVAGGLRNSRIGDVVAATKVYGYESGQDTDEGWLPRPESAPVSFAMHQMAMLVSEKGEWTEPLGSAAPPRVFHRPIASGSNVVTGSESETAQRIARYSGDAQCVDTESYGAMVAAARHSSVAAIVVRGVSDLLQGKDKEKDLHDQPRAARNATVFALALVKGSIPRSVRPAERRGTTYIGALGDGASANIAAMGDRAKGRIIFDQRDQLA
jgi:nucleoside phosphorylase